jgi:hypothetical protein
MRGVGPLLLLVGVTTSPLLGQDAALSAASMSGTYQLSAVCVKSCGQGFLLRGEQVVLVLNDTTIEVALANRVALARLRWAYVGLDRSVGRANACFAVRSSDGRLRMVRLAHWSRIPDDSVVMVTLTRSMRYYRVLLARSANNKVIAALPTRDVPVPDSLVQLSGLRSGAADPGQCMRDAERLYADSVSTAR